MTYPFDLGRYSRPVQTSSPEAQLWFDRGLNWLYGFAFEESALCFRKAIAADPGLVLAHFGLGMAISPDYNFTWDKHPRVFKKKYVAEIAEVLADAQAAAKAGSDLDRALIAALELRRISDPELEDFAPQLDAFADAMRDIALAHTEDLDLKAFYVEALMCRTPWQLWDLSTGEPKAGASTPEAMAVLEAAFADPKGPAWDHPGLLHLQIHLMEMSPHPDRALAHGDRLVGMLPDAGHLQHMATHIDVLCGRYDKVVTRNRRAWDADALYLRERGDQTMYSSYICHDLHFQLYGAMFQGQLAPALEAAEHLENLLTDAVVEPAADWMESYVPMRFHALVRFGEWQAILDTPLDRDPEVYSYTTAIGLYAKGIACAVTGDVKGAEHWQAQLREACARVPKTRVLFNNKCSDILAVANTMLEGELAYRKGAHDAAFAALRQAVRLEDGLPYEEPWGWMQPARHALGALLLEQGHLDAAIAEFRADLGLDKVLPRACQHPGNVWALRGLYEAYVLKGDAAAAQQVLQDLKPLLAQADRPIEASCFCGKTQLQGDALPVG